MTHSSSVQPASVQISGQASSVPVAAQPIPFDIIGFDLDGTLLDTAADLAAAVNHVLAEIGRPPFPVAAVRSFVGKGARVMLERALAASGGAEPDMMATLLPRLLDYYGRNLAVATTPYPGMVAALDMLAARGARLAVCTNKAERFARPLLAALGLADRFAAIVGGDTMGVGKPDPAPLHTMVTRAGGGRAIFVGDTVHDVEAARRAGMPCVAVSFGFSDIPVDTLGADAVIDDFAALVPLLENWPSA